MAKGVDRLKLKTRLVKWDESGWHSLAIEKRTAEKLAFKDRYRRVVCTINGGEPFQCALLPSQGNFYIIVNKKKREALGIVAGDKVDVELAIDESKYGLPMPEEFREVLDQDPDGDKIFHALTPGKQRSLLYYLGNIKDIDLRIHQALQIVEHIKEHGKVIDKLLYQELKRPKAHELDKFEW